MARTFGPRKDIKDDMSSNQLLFVDAALLAFRPRPQMTGWLVYAFHLQPYFRQAPQFHWLQATDLAEYKTCSRLLHQWYRWYQPARNFNGNCVRVINLLFIGEKGKGVRSSSWGMGGGRAVVDQEMATLTCVDNINPP